MNIETKYLGEVKISKDQIISFSKGLLGFESNQEFVLLSIPDNPHFKFLQDIHNSYICFILIEPWDIFQDYDIEIPDEKLRNMDINLSEESQFSVYNIVTLGRTFQESTANLLAPIIINLSNRQGKQFILNNSPYRTKHKLFSEDEKIANT